MTLVEALKRLEDRSAALKLERSRVIQTSENELKRVDYRIAAVDSVLLTLADKDQAVAVDGLLKALGAAGLRVEFIDQ